MDTDYRNLYIAALKAITEAATFTDKVAAHKAAKVINNEVRRIIKETGINTADLSTKTNDIATVITLHSLGWLNHTTLYDVLKAVLVDNVEPVEYLLKYIKL